TFRAEAKLSTWLNRLVRNSSYVYVHHRSNGRHHSFDGEEDADRNSWLAHAPLMGIDTRMGIQEAVGTLHREQRAVWMLTEIGGYSLNDGAGLQGVAEGTVKSRRSRAKSVLRLAIG